MTMSEGPANIRRTLALAEAASFLLAGLVGLRPGEICALRWGRVGPEMVNIMERVCRGLPGDPRNGVGQAGSGAASGPRGGHRRVARDLVRDQPGGADVSVGEGDVHAPR
jgi:hypothetical protein